MIATSVAQEQDREILLTAAKGVGLASTPLPRSRTTYPFTTLLCE